MNTLFGTQRGIATNTFTVLVIISLILSVFSAPLALAQETNADAPPAVQEPAEAKTKVSAPTDGDLLVQEPKVDEDLDTNETGVTGEEGAEETGERSEEGEEGEESSEEGEENNGTEEETPIEEVLPPTEDGDNFGFAALKSIAVTTDEPVSEPCTLTMVSDDMDLVVEKNDYAKELSEPLHDSWIEEIAGSDAKWIWGDDPVLEPTTNPETQTFKKSFTIDAGVTVTSAILTLASDNSHQVTLGTFSDSDNDEVNYTPTQDYDVEGGIVVGSTNTLEIEVGNLGVAGSNAESNPAGLIYELKITGTGPDSDCGEVVPEKPERPEEPEIEYCTYAGEIIEATADVDADTNAGNPVPTSRRHYEGVENGPAANVNPNGKESTYTASDFFSLGIEGYLVYEFTSGVAIDQTGDDIAIYEITGGNSGQSDETVEVLVSQDNDTYHSLGEYEGDAHVDIAPAGLAYVKYVKLIDKSQGVQGSAGDGYDVDAIVILYGSCGDEPQTCSITVVSDETNTVVEKSGAFAKLVSWFHADWNAIVAAPSKWIWGDDPVTDPVGETNQTFEKKFGWNGPVTSAELTIAADNSYEVSVNGDIFGGDTEEKNFLAADVHDLTSYIDQGNNTLSVAVKNWAMADGTTETNPAGLKYELVITGTDADCDIPYEDPDTDPDPDDRNQFNFKGYKFNNLNGDRDQDPGEEFLSGWTFRLYEEVGGVWTEIAEDVTDVDGAFSFPTIYEAGTYHVCEVSQAGWTQVKQDWSGTPYHIVTDNQSPNSAEEGPYCATAVYTDEADHSTKKYFGNQERDGGPIDDKTAEVTLCKLDTQQNLLSGWQLALLGDKYGETNVEADANTYSITDVPVGDYVLKASGTYVYRPTNLLADAAFSQRKAGDPGFGTYPYQPWRVTQAPDQHLGIKVNGDAMVWGTVYNPTHVYYADWESLNATDDLNFQITDTNYGDNSGELTVEAYEGYTGVTGDNGCVVFSDVPYGTYNIEELLQPGWENETGLGEVTVDSETETFNVVNQDKNDDNQPDIDTYRIEGYVWNDDNENEEWDENGEEQTEVALVGWTVNITNGADTYSTTTDTSGYYYFEVPAGTWTITEEVKNDWELTTQTSHEVTVPEDAGPVTLLDKVINFFLPTAHAAVIGEAGPYNFGNNFVGTISSARNSGGGGGGATRTRTSGTPTVAGDSTFGTGGDLILPPGMVLGDQVSIIPTGAPNAGAGGTSAPSFIHTLADLLVTPRRVHWLK